ncbi:hypothetical protein PoB_002970800 [Plakobranchus ocellatus]|uniref:Roadblock/LAMTOR2 domain-containing protein n=1 Tax=Plakobranchus ocellatus TaxID=259542 RepID=A0AAV4A7J8_9GAST|nr:hypothetical protein PoB_002970800 [Plakobranchus ocellatus]
MSWPDFISHVSATTAKVDKVLVYDPSGYPVAVTEGVETSQTEGQALVNCLVDSTMLLIQLQVDGDYFCCIQGAENNMVGRGVKDRDLVIAAIREGDFSVVFIGRSAGKGSFIFELQDTLSLRTQGRLLAQLQQQQQQQEQLLETDNLSGSAGLGAAAVDTDVLVAIP